MSRIESAAQRYERSLERLRADELAYDQALLDAYREGVTWSEIAQAAGLKSANQARLRAMRARDVDERPPSRRPGRDVNAGQRPLPGMSADEAAKELGISPPTVYRSIDRGELTAIPDAQGRTRVLRDEKFEQRFRRKRPRSRG